MIFQIGSVWPSNSRTKWKCLFSANLFAVRVSELKRANFSPRTPIFSKVLNIMNSPNTQIDWTVRAANTKNFQNSRTRRIVQHCWINKPVKIFGVRCSDRWTRFECSERFVRTLRTANSHCSDFGGSWHSVLEKRASYPYLNGTWKSRRNICYRSVKIWYLSGNSSSLHPLWILWRRFCFSYVY